MVSSAKSDQTPWTSSPNPFDKMDYITISRVQRRSKLRKAFFQTLILFKGGRRKSKWLRM